ncbi:hypothetical protein A7982_13659 [Minicystis rosea]|nr:hypothetical protein A7982_13659 [Minicystis rosea]
MNQDAVCQSTPKGIRDISYARCDRTHADPLVVFTVNCLWPTSDEYTQESP